MGESKSWSEIGLINDFTMFSACIILCLSFWIYTINVYNNIYNILLLF